MGSVSIVVYQPIAALLGYPKPGGISMSVPSENEPMTLHEAMKRGGAFSSAIVDALEQGEAARMSVIAVNGRVDRARTESLVRDGDVVSILPIYAGG